MKKFLAILMCAALVGCGAPKAEQSGKIKIAASLFPQYDFARTIAGDKADVELILPAGAESHMYEPSAQTIAEISGSDIFIYTSPLLEGWAGVIASSLPQSVSVVEAAKGIEIEEGEGEEHHHSDAHVWLNPQNALIMADNILAALIEADASNSDFYRENAALLKADIEKLDADLAAAVDGGVRRKIAFGGRFAMSALVERYNLEYESVYASCSSEAEPSAADVARVEEYIRANSLPVVYYEELADPKIARTIAEETGAEPLLLHSLHNTSAKERAENATYISLMRQNLVNLEKGLD